MNNKNNRYYHNCDEGDFQFDKLNIARFLIRCPPEYNPNELVDSFSNCQVNNRPIQFLKRTSTLARDYVDKYDFDVIPYDNSQGGDQVAFHANIFCPLDQTDFVKETIRQFYPEATFKDNKSKTAGLAITTHLYPILEINKQRGVWTTTDPQDGGWMMNRHPTFRVCVLSFERANSSGKTHQTLTEMGIHHRLFVEPKEEKEYREWYNPTYADIIVYPENFSEQQMGSTPARNYILDWGLDQSGDRVWMLDDNINGYNRLYHGVKNKIVSPIVFTHIEDYIERYDNVGAVGHNLNSHIVEGDLRTCIVTNNKCYTSMCLLTRPDIRFHHKYNEDVLISMLYIEKGLTNLCFNSVLYDKSTSGDDEGGNKGGIYKGGSQQGYKDKYEYLVVAAKLLFFEKKLTLIPGKTTEDLVSRDTRNKSKEYHHKVEYKFIKNSKINEHTKKENYDEIVATQNTQSLELVVI